MYGLQSSEEGVTSPGAGVTGSCEPPNVGTGNQVLWKNSLCFSVPLEVLGVPPTGRRDCCVCFPSLVNVKGCGYLRPDEGFMLLVILLTWRLRGLSLPSCGSRLDIGSLARASSVFNHRPFETGGVEQLMNSCLRNLYVRWEWLWSSISDHGASKYLRPVDKEGTCHEPLNLLRVEWRSQGTWINHTAREPFRTPFSLSVTQTNCGSKNIYLTKTRKTLPARVAQRP